MTTVEPVFELFAVLDAHRLETSLLQSRVEQLTAVLREHGIPIPGDDPRLGVSGMEHLQQCRDVVQAAYDLLDQMEGLRRIVGSGMELVRREAWRA